MVAVHPKQPHWRTPVAGKIGGQLAMYDYSVCDLTSFKIFLEFSINGIVCFQILTWNTRCRERVADMKLLLAGGFQCGRQPHSGATFVRADLHYLPLRHRARGQQGENVAVPLREVAGYSVGSFGSGCQRDTEFIFGRNTSWVID
jgi:hypothetical protein